MCVTHILGIIEGATQGVGQRVVEGFDKGIEEVDHENVEEDNEGDGEGNDGDDVYFVKVRYLSDGDDDDELQVGTENDVQEDAELEEEREKELSALPLQNVIGESLQAIVGPHGVKSSQEENNCCVSFQNKMVNVAAIADHFEATIRDHPKLKLKEIQRRVVSEMHVNVNITRCKRAKKRVNEKLFGNFKEEFAMLWDYADELRLKNPVKKTFDQSKKDGIDWQMVWNDENGCEVKRGRKQYIMNILERICSCRSWQITGLPCPHACCAIWHMGGDPDDYLDQYYHKQTYMKAYAYALHSINGAHEWAKSEIEPVLPPIEKKKRCQEDQR
ncbi:hypothetical protein V6N11_079579 [Hibiscus sabdariffa]|uniref:SWIM-type domain-containing protein n=1 Tax=Hibiscus sabdariffa TaxID=183260 RepID=A0ABR2RWB7_9ROSI